MNTSNGDNEKTLNESMHQEWIEQLQSSEIQEVRQEMVAKYVSFGKTIEDAEKEVDKFLSDPEQSLQYLEMREYAKSQELMGANAESLMFLVGAFLLGVCGSAAIKYFDLVSILTRYRCHLWKAQGNLTRTVFRVKAFFRG